MTEQIDQEKVDALHKYFLAEGSDSANDVQAQLGEGTDIGVYVTALKEKYPDAPYLQKKRGRPPGKEIANREPVVKEDLPKAVAKKDEPTTVMLLDPETGIVEELEITSIKGSKIYAQKKVSTEIVTIKIKGRDVDVDLIRLRKMKATEQLHGLPVNQLIMLADIAKGA